MKNGNFKVRCISLNGCNANNYTVGKVYEVKDGQLTTDNGFKLPTERKIGSFEDWEAFSSSEFELVNSNTTVIYHKGRETIAMLKDGNKVIKTAKAICNPKDEYNARYGEKLAFARLHGLEEQVTDILLNGVKDVKTDGNFKARCIKTNDAGLTVGKVYEFKNGYSKWNDGTRLPQFKSNGISRFRNFTDLEEWFSIKSTSKFDEVIEEPIPAGTPITAPQPFDWEGFKSGKIAVHCDTEEKAKVFLLECEHHGIQWAGGDNPTDKTNFEVYGKFTCYSCIWGNTRLGYADVNFHKGERPIIDYTPNFREVKRTAKAGEWVKIVNAKNIPTTNGIDDYKNGDILKVIENKSDSRPRYADGDNGCARILNHNEYVVLEPIYSTTEEPNPINLALVSIDALLDELRKRVK